MLPVCSVKYGDRVAVAHADYAASQRLSVGSGCGQYDDSYQVARFAHFRVIDARVRLFCTGKLDSAGYVHILSMSIFITDSFMSSATATARIVVQATPAEKRSIAAKAKGLGIPVSELMRRGAQSYTADDTHEELAQLADQAKSAADRACAAIDASLDFVTASNARIAKMERR